MTKNLFNTRGGVAMIDRCEECNEKIDEDSLTGLCPTCEREAYGEDDE